MLKMQQIMKLTGIGRSTMYNLIRSEQWPQPIKITKRSNRWLSTEVDAMIGLRASDATVDVIRAKVKELEAARINVIVQS
jgi:prophage regulatory protein